jgi:hypothetical protein
MIESGTMLVRRVLRCALAAMAVAGFAAPLHAQIGEQPIRIIFPFAPGGSGDTVARLIANKMSGALGRPVIVENRTGADGRIGVKAVKDSASDGSTLLLTPIAPLAIYQHFYTHLDYDPFADFVPVSELGTFDFGIAVGPQTDAKTLKDLVDWAKANPADANYDVRPRRQDRSASGAVSWLRRRADRSCRRAYPDRDHDHGRSGANGRGRPHPRLGDLEQTAFAVPAERADVTRSGL